MPHFKCVNCSPPEGTVSVDIPCPECMGQGFNEIDELRLLAHLVREYLDGRSRPPRVLVKAIERVNLSQGRRN